MNHLSYLRTLIEREGGYVDHPSDKGGPTKFGITEAVARDFGYRGGMRDLPQETAEDIYVRRYWLEPRFNEVERLCPPLAEEMLDTGVNMGQQWPVRFLQRALNVLNARGSTFTDLVEDGSLGTRTLAALKRLLDVRGPQAVPVLLRLMDAQQAVRYMDIARTNEKQEDFMFGWVTHRINNVKG